MLSENIVFVLGAGASIPYGFPSGADLAKQILMLKKSDVPAALDGVMCEKVYSEMGFDHGLMPDLQFYLRHTQVESIDQFLAIPHHSRFIELGRFLIAALLIPHERHDRLFGNDDTVVSAVDKKWYRLIWRHISDYSSMSELLAKLHITFITFNYDRSLEHYLWNVLRFKLNATNTEIRDFISKSIFHVHGQLGSYRGVGDGPRRHYEPHRDLETIRKAMLGIRVIHEVSELPRKTEINARISRAKKLIFLGASYNEDNLNKLLSGLSSSPRSIMGTSYGLSGAEAAAARQRISKMLQVDEKSVLIGQTPSLGSYDFLREHVQFI